MKQKIEDIPGYYDVFAKLLEDLPPHKRLVGMTPEQQVLALSDEVLREFPDTYLRTLSTETQQTIRNRIGRPS